jgi:hypothetical protein
MAGSKHAMTAMRQGSEQMAGAEIQHDRKRCFEFRLSCPRLLSLVVVEQRIHQSG